MTTTACLALGACRSGSPDQTAGETAGGRSATLPTVAVGGSTVETPASTKSDDGAEGSGQTGGGGDGGGSGVAGAEGGTLVPIVPQTSTVAALPEPKAVTMDLQGLAGKLGVERVASVPFNPEMLAAGNGTPPALRGTFDDTPITADHLNPRERQLLVYPAGGFHELYRGTNMATLADRVDRLAALLSSEPLTISIEIPLLPELGASQDLAVKKRYLAFANGRGIRFVAHYGQGPSPFTNQSIFYAFQGLTADGQYYVSLFYPVRSDALPDQFSDLSDAENSEIMNNYAVYRARMDRQMNAEPDGSFTPDLAKLDAMIESLRVGN